MVNNLKSALPSVNVFLWKLARVDIYYYRPTTVSCLNVWWRQIVVDETPSFAHSLLSMRNDPSFKRKRSLTRGQKREKLKYWVFVCCAVVNKAWTGVKREKSAQHFSSQVSIIFTIKYIEILHTYNRILLI